MTIHDNPNDIRPPQTGQCDKLSLRNTFWRRREAERPSLDIQPHTSQAPPRTVLARASARTRAHLFGSARRAAVKSIQRVGGNRRAGVARERQHSGISLDARGCRRTLETPPAHGQLDVVTPRDGIIRIPNVHSPSCEPGRANCHVTHACNVNGAAVHDRR